MTYSYRLLHMDTPVLLDQQILTLINSVRTFDAVLRIYQERWSTERERERERERELKESVLSLYIYIYIYIYIVRWDFSFSTDNSRSSSSSSSHAISTDIPDPLSPPLPIVHRFRQVFRATSRIGTELLMEVQAGRPAFVRPCEGVHRSTSLMCSSLLLQQWPVYLVLLILIVFVMDGKWPYSCCFVGCCL